jgi:hypothetical protein
VSNLIVSWTEPTKDYVDMEHYIPNRSETRVYEGYVHSTIFDPMTNKVKFVVIQRYTLALHVLPLERCRVKSFEP